MARQSVPNQNHGVTSRTPKYEIAQINDIALTVDVSLLAKTDEMFFNATEMAKQFGKRPDDFWKQEQNREYLAALVTLSGGNEDDFIKTLRGGKYQGTWFHKDLTLQFARWLSPIFAVRLDQWTLRRIDEEHGRRQQRREAKTGFLPMTDAILHAHDPAESYHFSNEADMINRIVLGMSAREFKKERGVESIRDALNAKQLAAISRLQIINTGLIEIGLEYADRKAKLIECHQRQVATQAPA